MTPRLEAKPFTIHVADAVLEDLQQRLRNTRTPRAENHAFETRFGKDYGQNAEFQAELLEHWTNAYDWRKFERELNAFPHFTMDFPHHDHDHAETQLHFIHQRGNAQAVPLLLVHGWPGSVWEFHHLLPLLADKFHLVVPSLPGFAWSKTSADEMHVERIAHLFNELMKNLGYDQYVAQGGDWGSFIVREIAFHHPQHCVAMHSNMPMFIPRPSRALLLSPSLGLDLALSNWRLTPFDRAQLANTANYMATGSAYMLMNASKPHTIGYAMADSPAGLLAYISEKIALWADPASALSKDEIITNVMIYWVTGSITSSLRIYYETLPMGKAFSAKKFDSRVDLVQVPCGFAFMPKEAICFPVKWLKLLYNVVHATEFPVGGHFAAWEQPSLLAKDIERFVFHSIGSFDQACKQAKERKYEPHTGVTALQVAQSPAAAVATLALFAALLTRASKM